MVRVLNPRTSKFNRTDKNHQKTPAPITNRKLIEKKSSLSGKLPSFQQKEFNKRYDDKLVKSLFMKILEKKVVNTEKQAFIKNLLDYIRNGPSSFVVKKWTIRALESALKYGDASSRTRICSVFKEHSENILKCDTGKKLVFKIFKYIGNKSKCEIFDGIRDKIFKFQLCKNSISVSNKIFCLLSNPQKRDLLSLFLNLDPESPETITNMTSKEQFIDLYPEKYSTFLGYMQNFVKVSIKNGTLISTFFCYALNNICSRIKSSDVKEIMLLFESSQIIDLFCCAYGVYSVCRYIRICSESDFEFVISHFSSTICGQTAAEFCAPFLLTAFYDPNFRSYFYDYIVQNLIENFELCADSNVWCQLISHIIEPKNKKLLALNMIEFLDHCDVISQTPSSSFLYKNFMNDVLPSLISYFNSNMTKVLSCNLKANILLQLVQLYYDQEIARSFFKIDDLLSRIAELSVCSEEDNIPLFSAKQVSWTVMKLLYDDIGHSFTFVRILVSYLDEKTLISWRANKSTSFLISKILSTSPSDIKNLLEQKLKLSESSSQQ